MAPGFDVAKARPDTGSFFKGDDGLAFQHFLLHVVGATLGNASTTGFGTAFVFIANDLGKIHMRGICRYYQKIILVHIPTRVKSEWKGLNDQRLRPGAATNKMQYVDTEMGKLSSHRHGVWTYKKTRPARHSKKPTLVEGVHDHLGNQRYK
jgi:hypothetical protein